MDGMDVVYVYNEAVDAEGHANGPDSDEVYAAVRGVDAALGKFLEDLEAEGLLANTDIVIVSDHGMTSLADKKDILVTKALNKDDIEVAVEAMAYMMIKVKEGVKVASVVADLETLEGVKAWASKDVPAHLKFADHPRLLDILVYSEGPAMLLGDERYDDVFIPDGSGGVNTLGGHHGWDDSSPNAAEYREGENPDMRTIFYAMGPSFNQGYVQDWIKLVDEYQILAYMTGTIMEEHSGNWDRVKNMFASNDAASFSVAAISVISAVVSVIL
jgi:predicted AlkP superfamily pyrophosphatase or phosphodiesterase